MKGITRGLRAFEHMAWGAGIGAVVGLVVAVPYFGAIPAAVGALAGVGAATGTRRLLRRDVHRIVVANRPRRPARAPRRLARGRP